MAIKIHEKAPAPEQAPDQASAHDEAAAEIQTEIGKTMTEAGTEKEPLSQTIQTESIPVNLAFPFERIEVGMSFKMPVASYTMLEFSVRRSVPFNPVETNADTVFDSTHKWVEEKLNQLIEEQQNET